MRGSDKFSQRTIDLDLILYGNRTMKEEELTLPDPDIMSRPFLAVPLVELAPGLVLPGQLPVSAFAKDAVRTEMTPLTCYTEPFEEELLYGLTMKKSGIWFGTSDTDRRRPRRGKDSGHTEARCIGD